LFDLTVSMADVQVMPEEDHVQLGLIVAMQFPTAQGVMSLPVGLIRANFSGESAIAKGQEMIEAGQAIKPPPEETLAKHDFVVASSMQGVEQVAQTDAALRKGT
jgi:hypothetical protein